MSTITNRHSLDFDPEFEDMLAQMRRTNLHSSTVQCSPTAVNCGIQGNDGRRRTCSPPSPDAIDSTDLTSSPPIAQQVQSSKKQNAVNIVQIGDVIHLNLDGFESEDEDSEEEGVMNLENMDIDLNATYTIKTMGRRKLSALFEALQESGDEHISPKLRSATSINIAMSRQVPDSYATPSPHTPDNQASLVSERRHRLGHTSSCSRPRPLCGYTSITHQH